MKFKNQKATNQQPTLAEQRPATRDDAQDRERIKTLLSQHGALNDITVWRAFLAGGDPMPWSQVCKQLNRLEALDEVKRSRHPRGYEVWEIT